MIELIKLYILDLVKYVFLYLIFGNTNDFIVSPLIQKVISFYPVKIKKLTTLRIHRNLKSFE